MDNTFEKAKSAYGTGAYDDATLEFLFPQLKESEDERIRKAILGLTYIDGIGPILTKCSITAGDIRAYLEKQKDASYAIEAVERIDKYIDEHLANAHDMKDSNPDKKYYRGWDDALGKMAGILQDVYSVEKKEESLRDFIDNFPYSDEQKEQKPELVQQPPITYTYNSNASRDERLKAALLALLNSDLLKVKEGGYFTKQDLIEWVDRIPTDKPAEKQDYSGLSDLERTVHRGFLAAGVENVPVTIIKETAKECLAQMKPAEWSEDIIRKAVKEVGLTQHQIDWFKTNVFPPKQEWSEEEAKKAAEDYADKFPGMTHENDGSTIEDYDKPYDDFMAGVLWAKHQGIFQNGNTHKKPSEEKKKETLDGADIGYGLETAIDILENGFTHYQTDDGEYERKQALDVLIFLLNESRKKEDAKLWSKDIVESIVTWATEKLQLYSTKESTPYVEAVKNNAQKVLDWAKEQWPIYFGWKPSDEQMEALKRTVNKLAKTDVADSVRLSIMYDNLKKLM